MCFTYIEISKDSSAKYYQNNKERLPKKACERYQSLTKKNNKNKKATIGSWMIQKFSRKWETKGCWV